MSEFLIDTLSDSYSQDFLGIFSIFSVFSGVVYITFIKISFTP